MSGLLWVALGGALGSAARYGVNIGAAWILGKNFPWGTFIVNVLGSFVMGLLAGLLMRKFTGDENLQLFLLTGILGGFTTFSAFSLDAANLMERGENGLMLVYVLGSVILAILALFAGFLVERTVAG